MKKLPLVSVIIVNWNGSQFLPICLTSILTQSYNNIEIIFIDNGSDDDSLKIVSELSSEIKTICNPKNFGYSVANNMGIDLSRGEYILTLNNDTEAHPDMIQKLVKAMDTKDKIGICFPKQLNFYQRDIIDSLGIAINKFGSGFDKEIGKTDLDREDNLLEAFGAPGAGAMYRKSMLSEIGAFDEDFFMYHEELDLSWRARLSGWEIFCVPLAILYHRRGATSNRIRNFVKFYTQRNRLFYLVKNLHWQLFIKYIGSLVLCELDNWRYILFCFDLTRLKARVDFIKYLPKMLHRRWGINKLKRVSWEEIDRWFM